MNIIVMNHRFYLKTSYLPLTCKATGEEKYFSFLSQSQSVPEENLSFSSLQNSRPILYIFRVEHGYCFPLMWILQILSAKHSHKQCMESVKRKRG